MRSFVLQGQEVKALVLSKGELYGHLYAHTVVARCQQRAQLRLCLVVCATPEVVVSKISWMHT